MGYAVGRCGSVDVSGGDRDSYGLGSGASVALAGGLFHHAEGGFAVVGLMTFDDGVTGGFFGGGSGVFHVFLCGKDAVRTLAKNMYCIGID